MELELQLKGVMQSYGVNNPWTSTRRTQATPTITAIRGMVECALGLAKEGVDVDDDAVRTDMWKNVDIMIHPIDHMPDILTDDQTVHPLTDDMAFISADGKRMSTGMPQIEKEYIIDECFWVTLKGTDEYICRIKYFLEHPVYPYCLGRSCCIPSKPVILSRE